MKRKPMRDENDTWINTAVDVIQVGSGHRISLVPEEDVDCVKCRLMRCRHSCDLHAWLLMLSRTVMWLVHIRVCLWAPQPNTHRCSVSLHTWNSAALWVIIEQHQEEGAGRQVWKFFLAVCWLITFQPHVRSFTIWYCCLWSWVNCFSAVIRVFYPLSWILVFLAKWLMFVI